jgi:hypothetical protein
MDLDSGASITTGHHCSVYLTVNGLSSSVRVDPDTTLVISRMDRSQANPRDESQTVLNVKAGLIIGQVKKVSANSSYEIETPNGLAQIRGTDFGIDVFKKPTGVSLTTFSCFQGRILVSAPIGDLIQTNLLNTGQAWVPGEGEPGPIPKSELDRFELDPFPRPEPPLPPPPQIAIQPVFPTGSPPHPIVVEPSLQPMPGLAGHR